MPPLLLKLSERPPKEHLQWLGVSYGITSQLHKFWKRAGYTPVYLRQTANELTGEHTCIMLKQLSRNNSELTVANQWLPLFSWDFRRRFLELLAYQFRNFSSSLVLSILQACDLKSEEDQWLSTPNRIYKHFSPHDLKRLDSYSQNLLDYHVIMDLIPSLSKLYFLNQFKFEQESLQYSAVQAAIILGLGLQKKSVEDMESDLGLSVSQILAIFAKAVKKASLFLEQVLEKGVAEQVESSMAEVKSAHRMKGARNVEDDMDWDPSKTTLDEDLEEAGNEVLDQLKEQKKELIDSLNLNQ
jgi:N-acetyltransferase 10